jgi:hypothetical protein
MDVLRREQWHTPWFSSASFTPIAAATPTVAIRLCPQECPMPGSASNSELNDTARPSPLSYSARNAVLMLYALRVTLKPCSSRNSVSVLCACTSLYANSGFSQICGADQPNFLLPRSPEIYLFINCSQSIILFVDSGKDFLCKTIHARCTEQRTCAYEESGR